MRISDWSSDVCSSDLALYPRLTIPGSLGIEAGGIGAGDIVTAVIGSLTAVIDLPLFDAGARRAEVTAAEERAQQTLIAYRQTLLRALEEVEAALIGHAGAGARATALREAVAANQLAAERARSLYTQGLVGFIDVLDAQRELTDRSEEHTSELQSLLRLSYAGFCLTKKRHRHNPNNK